MDLRDLETERSFALLAAGYTGGAPVLLTALEADADGPLVFCPFEEADASRARRFGGVGASLDGWELPAPVRSLEISLDDAGYLEAVEQIREQIAAGDVYQVCLTVRAGLGAPAGSELLSLLCARGVPRYAAWVRLPDGTEFVSASPELLLEVKDGRAHSQPMKGTAPPDRLQALLDSEKDRAELAMITDLVRNDLTPVCVPRSVRVVNERRVLTLPYAVQTVSDVEGTLAPGRGWRHALAALHPGGSVTGAPKHAALTTIRALEKTPRGAYCGVLGWAPAPDEATFALLIRTAEKRPNGWSYGVGSGVVYDSQPARELEELRVKLRALTPAP